MSAVCNRSSGQIQCAQVGDSFSSTDADNDDDDDYYEFNFTHLPGQIVPCGAANLEPARRGGLLEPELGAQAKQTGHHKCDDLYLSQIIIFVYLSYIRRLCSNSTGNNLLLLLTNRRNADTIPAPLIDDRASRSGHRSADSTSRLRWMRTHFRFEPSGSTNVEHYHNWLGCEQCSAGLSNSRSCLLRAVNN